jgi:hypothetical protein
MWSCFFNKKKKKLIQDRWINCCCKICSKKFLNTKNLILHLGGHDIKKINYLLKNNFGTVKCLECGRSFNNAYLLSIHECEKISDIV